MSCWGPGITQSDEYCDVYERFMEEYDEGKPVRDIVNDILEGYLLEFEEDDGVLHDVYFALGKAEWMCGGISDLMLERISFIVQNDKDIEFLKELEADEKFLKQRKKNLDKFLASLKIPRERIRKRKIPVEKYIPKEKPVPLPNVKVGDVLCLFDENVYHIFAITERMNYLGRNPAVYCYSWKNKFKSIPSLKQLLEEEVFPLGIMMGKDFPDMKKVVSIMHYPALRNLSLVDPRVINKKCRPYVYVTVGEEQILLEYPEENCMTLRDVFEKIDDLLDAREKRMADR